MVSEFDKDTLHALASIARADACDEAVRTKVVEILASVAWSDDSFSELTEIRSAVSRTDPARITKRVRSSKAPSLPARRSLRSMLTTDHGLALSDLIDHGLISKNADVLTEQAVSDIVTDWILKLHAFQTDQTETLSRLCEFIDQRLDSAPGSMATVSALLYETLAKSGSENRTFINEYERHLGELARLAGTACRVLHRHDDALLWLERARTWFLETSVSTNEIANVEYQRLAVYMEQRRLQEVLTLSGRLRRGFLRAGLKELALKCEYARAMALRELGRSAEALTVFERVYSQACEIHSTKIIGPCLVMLVQVHSDLGNAEQAVRFVEQAVPVLTDANNRVALAKLYSGIGLLFRSQRRNEEAIRAFRTSQEQLGALELRAEVAALNLLIADILLEGGQERQAEWEIRSALPVIDELKMVPEGFAAMSLLRESLRRRSIDRQALRKLHGYFEEANS